MGSFSEMMIYKRLGIKHSFILSPYTTTQISILTIHKDSFIKYPNFSYYMPRNKKETSRKIRDFHYRIIISKTHFKIII